MKRLLFLLLIPSIAFAQEVKVFQFTDDTAIILGPVPCKKGNKAVIQRVDGKHIKGCWYEDPTNKDNYRIDWDNPARPGDFAVIPKANFHVEDL